MRCPACMDHKHFCAARDAETLFKSLTGKNRLRKDDMLTMYYSQQHNKDLGGVDQRHREDRRQEARGF